MKSVTVASFLIAIFSIPTLTSAQNVYKCGNAYGDRPCPKGQPGEVVDVADPRTAAQKAQADADTRRLARTADEMEKKRLNEEARALAANRPITAPKAAPPQPTASATHVKRRTVRRHESPYFTAREPQAPASGKRPQH